MTSDTVQIPDTTTFRVQDNVLHWKNEEFLISVEEAEQIKNQVEEKLDAVQGIVVDNAEAGGPGRPKLMRSGEN